MELVNIFLEIISDLSLIIGAVFVGFWFQYYLLDKMIFGLILIVCGTIARLISKY